MYGDYVGGSLLDDNYNQETSGPITFKYHTQLRNLKQLSINQKTLMDAKRDSSMLKFDGVLDAKGESNQLQFDKEQCISDLGDEVNYYVLESTPRCQNKTEPWYHYSNIHIHSQLIK